MFITKSDQKVSNIKKITLEINDEMEPDVPANLETVFPKKLYEAEIARQLDFSSAIGSLNRRLTPCCSQFYVPMVMIGRSPPFEGLIKIISDMI